MSFVHLHVHTHYSMLEATCTPDNLAATATKYQMPAVAITDNGNMYGAIDFYNKIKDKGMKPIFGLEALLAPKSRHEKTQDRDSKIPNRRLVLLAQDYVGYQNLCEISTIGFMEGFYYKPRVDYEVLRKFNNNVIALTGGNIGEVPWLFRTMGGEAALDKIRELKEIYDDRLYLELNRTGLPDWQALNSFLLEASKITGVPVVAANDVHYMSQDDQIGQEVLICIGTNKNLHDETRFRLGSDQFYFKNSEEMRDLFKDIPEACDRTLEIAERCNVKFKLKDENGKTIYHLPVPPTKDGLSLKDEIRRKAYEGLDRRLLHHSKTNQQELNDDGKKKYLERLEYELGVIDKMGFNGYYLIVEDFINWAKSHDVAVGPGRGSGAGSLVAFCLGITDLDPLPHKLVFERFLNPERISMPDFDIDFCQESRYKVIDYVTQKYGAESVSQIVTFGKLMCKAAIRDVGRVLGKTYADVDVIAKLIPDELNITIDKALEQEPRLKQLMDDDPEINTMITLAKKIEGLNRQAGIHAAGVVIGDDKLVHYAPLSRGAKGETVVQYDMKRAEKIGLIKFDFLGLKTLDHISETLRLIKKNRGVELTTADISINDPFIYEVMSNGDTCGVFQFEGDGITEATKKIRPSCFADITAINALYRPGPMDMIPEYTDRKHGKKEVTYLFPELEELLKETYGIIVYQEQVQLIAARIASYSLGEADLLRRAMGKKDAAEMERQRSRFLDGAKKNGHDPDKAAELFELMYKFADYGFNKAHAAAYCVVAAHTAWLKHYYPVEFYAALLTTELGDTDKVAKYAKDARDHGIEVRPPHVNYSDFRFSVNGDVIYFGLGAIKGIGHSAIDAITANRETKAEKKFVHIEDFFNDLDLKSVNKKSIECLIKAGALEGLGQDQATLIAGYSQYVDRAESNRAAEEIGQFSLFEMIPDSDSAKVILQPQKPWSRPEKLAYEKEVLGFYLSDHPLRVFRSFLSQWTNGEIADIKKLSIEQASVQQPAEPQNNSKSSGRGWPMRNKKRVMMIGLVTDLREIITKKATRMAFAKLEDLSDSIELIAQPEIYQNVEMLLKQDQPVAVAGGIEVRENVCRLLVDTVITLNDFIRKVKKVEFNLKGWNEEKISELKSVLSDFIGSVSWQFKITLLELDAVVVLEPSEPKGLLIDTQFIERLTEHFGSAQFVDLYM